LAHLGERDRAMDWAARAIAIDPDESLAHYNMACVYSLLGELDRAIDHLENVIPHISSELKLWFKNDSDLDPVRDHPRYHKLFETQDEPREPSV
jgi:adenylate cyclase